MRSYLFFLPLLATAILSAAPCLAHDYLDHDHGDDIIPAAIEQNRVKITHEGDYLLIEGNGIPNHTTGQFPNRNNPNSISEQNYHYRVPAHPQISGQDTQMQMQPFGIALNGIPFDPATAECYDQHRGPRNQDGGRPPPPRDLSDCQWKEEAIVNGEGKLGLDSSNAHVQPNGAYHYHGIPTGLLTMLLREKGMESEDGLVMVGYAADGFKMYVSPDESLKPSYRLKSGTRPSGEKSPGGAYDGTYTQDFEYVAGSGDLDECNGRMIDGAYGYVLTRSFPFIPRCWKGAPDASFGRHAQGGRQGRPHGPGRDGLPPPPF